MRIFKIDKNNPSIKAIKFAAEVIKKGGVIIYPTDTIYGLGANALDKNSVKKIYEVKKRPETKPLSIVVKDIKMAKKYCRVNKIQHKIFNALLPGPFTLIFKAKSVEEKKGLNLKRQYDSLDYHATIKIKERFKNTHRKNIFTGYKNTLSVRIPDFKITSLLAKELKMPFIATSANISGLPGSGDISKVLKQLGINKKNPNLSRRLGIDLVLDAGVLPKKNPSTIIDLTGKSPKIIRK